MAQPPAYDGFAIDLDGVVWLAREPIAGSPEAIERLRAAGRAVAFVTNDPRSTREELAGRLTEIGAPTAPEAILTSASIAAEVLGRERPGAAVLALGTDSLEQEIGSLGLELLPLTEGVEPDVVVVGGGARFDNEVLRIASRAVRAGADLWATNKDPTYPTLDGLAPGTGAIVAALETASGVEARNIGKPEPTIFESALALLGCERPLMAGDSLGSDIAGAARAGLATALILTGHASREEAEAAEVEPDRIYEDLAALAEDLA